MSIHFLNIVLLVPYKLSFCFLSKTIIYLKVLILAYFPFTGVSTINRRVKCPFAYITILFRSFTMGIFLKLARSQLHETDAEEACDHTLFYNEDTVISKT